MSAVSGRARIARIARIAIFAAVTLCSALPGHAVLAMETGAGGRGPLAGRVSAPGPAPRTIAEERKADLVSVIGGSSTCPLPASVWAELGTLVPLQRLTEYRFSPKTAASGAATATATPATVAAAAAHRSSGANAGMAPPGTAAAAPKAPIEVIDIGSQYRVVAAGKTREYRDDARDCAYRARVAAVFVALAIDPAALVIEPEPHRAQIPPGPGSGPPVAFAAARPAEPTLAPRPSTRLAHLDIGLAVDRAAGAGPRATHAGASLRLVAGRGSLAFVVGMLALLPTDTKLGELPLMELRLNQRRYPLELGLRARWQRHFVEPYAEAGLGVALVAERALNLVMNRIGYSAEIGGFGSLGIRVAADHRVAVFVAARGEWVARRADIVALPAGVVGQTPHFWIAVMAGASIQI